MSGTPASQSDGLPVDLDHFRGYLTLLARTQLGRGLRRKLNPSDIVQQTLLEAHKDRDGFRGETSQEQAGWLRRILANNMANTLRDFRRQKRDVGRERPLEATINDSAMRLDGWLAAHQTTPSGVVANDEERLRVAEALASLPEAQQDAIVLRYCEDLTLDEIGAQLDVSASTAAREIRRGFKALRERLRIENEPE